MKPKNPFFRVQGVGGGESKKVSSFLFCLVKQVSYVFLEAARCNLNLKRTGEVVEGGAIVAFLKPAELGLIPEHLWHRI